MKIEWRSSPLAYNSVLVQHTEKILTWLENLLQILPIHVIIFCICIDIKIDVNVGAEALKSIELGRPL